jgi:hypothetical protein
MKINILILLCLFLTTSQSLAYKYTVTINNQSRKSTQIKFMFKHKKPIKLSKLTLAPTTHRTIEMRSNKFNKSSQKKSNIFIIQIDKTEIKISYNPLKDRIIVSEIPQNIIYNATFENKILDFHFTLIDAS